MIHWSKTMYDSKFCRICLINNVQMHQLSGPEIQKVYERLSNKKFQEDVLYYTCYTCYSQLLKCKQLVTKLQKSKELLKHILRINNELNLNSITLQDRYTHGLVHSLTVTNTESLQTPDYIEIIKTEKQDESDTNELKIKDEPYEDNALPNEIADLDGKHNPEQDEENVIQIVKQAYVSGYQTNTEANENMLLQIVCGEKSKQGSVMNVENCFICNDCGEPCDTKALLVRHIRGHKSVISKPNNDKYTESDNFKEDFDIHVREKPFKCQYCNFRSLRQDNLKRHIKTHTTENPLKCRYCNYTTTENRVLRTHNLTHTGEKPFKCEYCNYRCARSGNLKRHFRTHTGEKPMKCQYCNHTCAERGNLKRHTRTHTSERPLLKCQYCTYTTTRNHFLRSHIIIHTGEKPFKCQHCDYATTKNHFLRRHIATHTGEKPLQCQYCNYACVQSGSLQRHIRTHTGEKPLKCKYCKYITTENRLLTRHIETHTGEINTV